ncbi:hypothetical protein NUU61_005396 [Penicillium alfredii]|uniref:Uncharacterized protein n=1 Tax=Penicillium alfredii TaxID=1506179 RepID=A0A9W9F9K4_9EURO|nr:uncharacterized protein NUU61_005396 [Penicillium alfredii]KAJ5096040.1 hypothetical protein NUU61_005396 [Penicillium alfredii]
MRPQILLHPQLRTALPQCAQRGLRNQIWARFKSQVPMPSKKHDFVGSLPKGTVTRVPETPSETSRPDPPQPESPPKTVMRKGPPERILVYYGGTGRAIYLGMLRVSTFILFGTACLIIAPACYSADYPWYTLPAIVAGGALPMVFVAYTAAPYVNFVHLALPAFARKTRETAIYYAKDLPPTAVLYITTTRFNTIPRQTAVRMGDILPGRQKYRPISFSNLNPAPRPWYRGKAPAHFFTSSHSRPGRQSTAFYPELWQHIYPQIQRNGLRRSY